MIKKYESFHIPSEIVNLVGNEAKISKYSNGEMNLNIKYDENYQYSDDVINLNLVKKIESQSNFQFDELIKNDRDLILKFINRDNKFDKQWGEFLYIDEYLKSLPVNPSFVEETIDDISSEYTDENWYSYGFKYIIYPYFDGRQLTIYKSKSDKGYDWTKFKTNRPRIYLLNDFKGFYDFTFESKQRTTLNFMFNEFVYPVLERSKNYFDLKYLSNISINSYYPIFKTDIKPTNSIDIFSDSTLNQSRVGLEFKIELSLK